MKIRTLLSLALIAFAGFASAQNWNTAIAGFSSYDVGEYQKAKTALETAMKHKDEFKAEDNAKVMYYHGLSVLKLGEGLKAKVTAYESFEAAKKFDASGSGTYKGTLEVEMDELKEKIKKHYEGIDHHADDRETLELFMKVSQILGYKGNYEDYKMKLESLEE